MAMWQKLSLRARLNTLLALVMVLGLVINIARLLLEAAPRVAAEDQSVVRLARGFVEPLVSDLNDAADPEARLDQIVEGLKQLRHVSITRDPGPGTPTARDQRPDGGLWCDGVRVASVLLGVVGADPDPSPIPDVVQRGLRCHEKGM